MAGTWIVEPRTGAWVRGSTARVQRAADGRRWCATIAGRPVEPAGRPGTLLTWETAEGARAHVERVLRRGRDDHRQEDDAEDDGG